MKPVPRNDRLDSDCLPAANCTGSSRCTGPMKPKKILIVEDDKVIQKLIADTLKAAGY
jgi:PleD family two-component response regulator